MTLLFPNAANLYTIHVGDQAGDGTSRLNARSLSPRLWARIAEGAIAPDASGGCIWASDDFTMFQGLSAAASGALTFPTAAGAGWGGYKCYIDQGASIVRSTTEDGGVIRFDGGDTDSDVATMGTGQLLALSSTAANAKLTIFEARVRFQYITMGSAYIGLASDACIANGGLIAANGGLIAGGAGVGFQLKEDDPDGLDFTYQAANQTEQTVIPVAQTIVANTWYNVGWIFDPSEKDSQQIKAFIDNTEQSTYVTATDMEAATFPDDERLGLYGATHTKTAGTDQKTMDVDWWAVYQAP